MNFSRFNVNIFLIEAIFYIASFAVAIASTLRIIKILAGQSEIAKITAGLPNGAVPVLPPDLANIQHLNAPEFITIGQFLIAFLIATLFFIILIKTKYGPRLFRLIFIIALFAGAQVIFRAWMNQELSIVFAFLMVLARYIFPRVIVHNISIIAAITGIAVNLGMNINISEAILILVAISVYDYLAVYVTGHMVQMLKSTISAGTIFAMVIPQNTGDFLKTLPVAGESQAESKRDSQRQFVYLGGGDLAFPLILAVSAAAKIGVISAVYVAAGTIAGLFILNIIFMMQKERRPMAGMPPLAAGAILGFLFSLTKF